MRRPATPTIIAPNVIFIPARTTKGGDAFDTPIADSSVLSLRVSRHLLPLRDDEAALGVRNTLLDVKRRFIIPKRSRCRETRSERTLESAIGVSKASPPLVVRAGMKMTLGAMMVDISRPRRALNSPDPPRHLRPF
eukprot:5735652-Pyramimonas_sp.AAC.1